MVKYDIPSNNRRSKLQAVIDYLFLLLFYWFSVFAMRRRQSVAVQDDCAILPTIPYGILKMEYIEAVSSSGAQTRLVKDKPRTLE